MGEYSIRAALLLALACGPSAPPPTMDALRDAIESPIRDDDDAKSRSRLVEAAAESDVLQGKRRGEVEEAIGRGDPCSRHAQCVDLGFQNDDWFYSVGASGGGFGGVTPILIVGFDRSGRVDRVWNLRIHEE